MGVGGTLLGIAARTTRALRVVARGAAGRCERRAVLHRATSCVSLSPFAARRP
jgi:hypothetical protein